MNAFLSLEECESFIVGLVTARELQAVQWVTLGDTDKQVYIDRAYALFSSWKFKGYTVELNQDEQFPRIINDVEVGVTDKIKKCLTFMTFELLKADLDKRLSLQASGVSEIKVDKMSEKFSLSSDLKPDIALIKNKQVQSMLRGVLKTNALVDG